jgi:hypothetical protein
MLRKYNMNIQVIDNAIDEELRKEVWNYLQDQVWYIKYKQDSSLESYVPSRDGFDVPNKNPLAVHGTTLARTALACDKNYLKARHKPIFKIWEMINHSLGDKYDITGHPEGLPQQFLKEYTPFTAIPNLKAGWRVYTNGQYQENIKHSHGVHRDNPILDDDTTATILYIANLEWYPTWFGEVVFYSDKATGDKQQFQVADASAQRRNFDIGWPEKIVAAVPGRIICYDGRTLHTTRPTALWAPVPRVALAFRARLK